MLVKRFTVFLIFTCKAVSRKAKSGIVNPKSEINNLFFFLPLFPSACTNNAGRGNFQV